MFLKKHKSSLFSISGCPTFLKISEQNTEQIPRKVGYRHENMAIKQKFKERKFVLKTI